MKKPLRISIIVLAFLVLIFAGLLIFFIVRRSIGTRSLLDSQAPASITVTQSQAENSNSITAEQDKNTTLVSQKVNVVDKYKIGLFADEQLLNLPANFKISVWADGFNKPRQITFTAENNMIISEMSAGNILLIKPSSDNTFAKEITIIDSGLNNPSGVFYSNGNLYVAEENQILLYRDLTVDGKYSSKEIIIPDLPVDGHSTRTVKVGPDNKLYITVGSSCNLCEESDERRASMLIADLDGTNLQVFASGLRNTVDFIFKSTVNDFKIWSVDNGRDGLGDDIPPEEVNIITQDSNYGWPYCYGAGINNPEYPERSGYCKTETKPATYSMQAHSAPLGLTFLVNDDLSQRTKFPQTIFGNDLFITFHGSWNRSVPTGYKVVTLDTSETTSKTVDFITGWEKTDGDVWGRPVDVKFDKLGDLFISDDQAGAIYKVAYTATE